MARRMQGNVKAIQVEILMCAILLDCAVRQPLSASSNVWWHEHCALICLDMFVVVNDESIARSAFLLPHVILLRQGQYTHRQC